MRLWTKRNAIKSVITTALILSLSGTVSTAKAEQILIHFSGEVSLFNDFICQCLVYVDFGSPVSGYYIYDSNTLDADPSPNIGRYEHSTQPNGIEVYVGWHRFSSNPEDPDFIVILHDSVVDEYSLHDSYRVWENNVLDLSLYIETWYVDVYLRDNTSTALYNDSLPGDAPNLDDWPTKSQIKILGSGFEIYIDITSISKGIFTGLWQGDPTQVPGFTLFPNAPNPFSSETRLNFVLPTPSDVTIEIFDITGRRLFAKDLHRLPSGLNSYFFDGRSQHGQLLPSGIYFYRLQAGAFSATKKMVLLR